GDVNGSRDRPVRMQDGYAPAGGRLSRNARPGAAPIACDGTTAVTGRESKAVSFAILEDYDKGERLADVERDFALYDELEIGTWRGSYPSSPRCRARRLSRSRAKRSMPPKIDCPSRCASA